MRKYILHKRRRPLVYYGSTLLESLRTLAFYTMLALALLLVLL